MSQAANRPDTIFALSTPPGRAGVAVVRASGPGAAQSLMAIAGAVPRARRATLATLHDSAKNEEIDRAIVLWFPGPASFTGEDMAEFHVHGGPAVVAALIETLAALPGFRPAEAGEFTRRAFDNGKLDLTEVEGLADLIDAETAAQRRQALRQMAGALGTQVMDWRERLLRALAYAEASIDFPDEELPETLPSIVRQAAEALSAEIAACLDDRRAGERLRAGLTIAIVGPPNAGKSSLLNALAKREAAIVSATAGTTRDVVEVHLDIAGYPVSVADTAGLRAALADDPAAEIEREGMRRTRARAGEADIVLAVVDLAETTAPDAESLALLTDRRAGESGAVVFNKADLAPGFAPAPDLDYPAISVSALTGAGLGDLLDWLAARVIALFPTGAQAPLISRARHRSALEACRDHLGRALSAAAPELAAEDLRLALRELGRITGQVDVEDLLDVIFQDFCIGK